MSVPSRMPVANGNASQQMAITATTANHPRAERALSTAGTSASVISCGSENTLIRARSPRDTMRTPTMPDVQIEVFRSALRAECHDRAFMLAAVGISSAIGFDHESYILSVDDAVAELAMDQLRSYAAETRPAPP